MSGSNAVGLPALEVAVLIVILVVVIFRLAPSVRADFRFRFGG